VTVSRRGLRDALYGLLACALAACGATTPRAPIRVPAPVLAPIAEPALPDAPGSTLTVALEVELEQVRAAIEAALPREEKRDFTLVTREGASPRIELRYFVERDEVAVALVKGALVTTVSLHYWADVRGAVKSPLPWQRDRWFELDRDQSWGTRAQPQRATLTVRSEARLDPEGALQVDSRVKRLDPGEPPAGSFCVKAGIRLCVGKQTFASDVDDAFERRVAPALRDALAALDRRLEREADVRARLQRAWRTLHCPWPLHRAGGFACRPDASEQGLWLQLRPSALTASGLARRSKRARVLVALDGAVAVTRGAPPASTAAPLPAVEQRKPRQTSVLHVPVAIPYELLSSQLALALPSGELSLGRAGKAKLVAARVVGARASERGAHVVLELRLAGGVDAVLYASARPRGAAGALELVELAYSEESERLFAGALPDVDHARLRLDLARALRVPLLPAAELAAQALSAAVAEPTLRPDLEIARLGVSELRPGARSLAALLTVEARIRVAVDLAAALAAPAH
jgi:hypothetical protein